MSNKSDEGESDFNIITEDGNNLNEQKEEKNEENNEENIINDDKEKINDLDKLEKEEENLDTKEKETDEKENEDQTGEQILSNTRVDITFSQMNESTMSRESVQTYQSLPFKEDKPDLDLPYFSPTKYETAYWKVFHSLSFFFIYSNFSYFYLVFL